MALKLGFDVSDLATGRADGTTRYTAELAKRLPELAPDSAWDYFAPFDSPALRGAVPRKPSVQVRFSPWPKYWTQARLPWDLYRFRPEVLFMPIQQLPFLRPRRMKTVAVIHDLAFHYFPEQFTRKDWLLLHVFSAQAAREADELICVSQATADDVAKFYGRTSGVHVVHHGVDHEQFRVPADAERTAGRQLLLQKYPQLQEPYILFVGQIQPRKNLVRLIEAFEISAGEAAGPAAAHPRRVLAEPARPSGDPQPRHPLLNLVIAGSHGWLNEPIKRRVEESTVRSRIHMIGRVPDELLPALYWQAEVFVLPSLYEGFGMPLLEAMACGCPVVTANNSSLPEVSGQAAVLVDPYHSGDIARGITEARQRREELIAAGIAQAMQFTWEATAKQTLAILRSAAP